MNWLQLPNWESMFKIQTPVLEIILRGSIIYLSLFFLLRIILKRQAGEINISDLLVIVLIADAAQNGMAGEYKSITAGIILVVTLILCNYILEWVSFTYPSLEKYIYPPALPLVRNGRLLRRNMRREYITEEELMSQLREQGIEEISQVKKAYLEGDGKISVIKR